MQSCMYIPFIINNIPKQLVVQLDYTAADCSNAVSSRLRSCIWPTNNEISCSCIKSMQLYQQHAGDGYKQFVANYGVLYSLN